MSNLLKRLRDSSSGFLADKYEAADRIEALEKQNAELLEALKQARTHIVDWWRPNDELPPAHSAKLVESFDNIVAESIGKSTNQSQRLTPRAPDRIAPTYYVRHPDDSYSVADPQPSTNQEASE